MAQAPQSLVDFQIDRRVALIAQQAARQIATSRLVQAESDFRWFVREIREAHGSERAALRRCVPAQAIKLRFAKGRFTAAWLGEMNAARDVARPCLHIHS